MKLGISYNLFDGDELLEHSINSVREHADFISVVYQTESYFGNPCSIYQHDILLKLLENHLVDEIVLFKPSKLIPTPFNELAKRNLGLKLSRNSHCTHHISMDVDEIYIGSEFEEAKKIITRGSYDSSFCQMKTYYHSTEYEISPPETYYVSIFLKIHEKLRYAFIDEYPVFVDPTRRVKIGNFKTFTRDEIEMHHLSYVRKDIRMKLENSSSLQYYESKVDEIVEYYKSWEYPKKVLLSGYPLDYQSVVKSNSSLPKISFNQG